MLCEINGKHVIQASGYHNEEAIGKAIRESDVPRSEIFVTTKLWHVMIRPFVFAYTLILILTSVLLGTDATIASVRRSRNRLLLWISNTSTCI